MKCLRYVSLIATACLLPGCGEEARSADVVATSGTMRLGAQTHFSQGWPTSAVVKANDVGATFLRDSIPWSSAERTRGDYDFSSPRVKALETACDSGLKLVLTQVPKNPIYDGGFFVHSDDGKQAYAAFLSALLKKFGTCVIAIEVGNEINGKNFRYPDGVDGIASYVSLLALLRKDVKPRFPGVAMLGGSTNQIGTGFLKKLFDKGMLREIDGVAVHPYRSHAQGVDLEIDHLVSVMRGAGRVVPIWATEFGHDLKDRDRAAGELIKMVTLLAGANVEAAAWYALLDQPHFPNFGLWANNVQKPQALAYATAQKLLLPHGRPTRMKTGGLASVWRFGNGTLVAWGPKGSLEISGSPKVYDAMGKQITSTGSVAIGDSPVIVLGGELAAMGDNPVIADTLLGFGSSQWTYLARPAKGADVPLSLESDNWSSFYGSRFTKPLRIGMGSAAPGGSAAKPVKAVLRYTSPTATSLDLSACFSKKQAGDGVDYVILRNGQPIRKGSFTQKEHLGILPVSLAAGDKLDIAFGPNASPGNDSFAYRVTLFRKGNGTQVECP